MPNCLSPFNSINVALNYNQKDSKNPINLCAVADECNKLPLVGCVDALTLTPFAEVLFMQGPGLDGSRCSVHSIDQSLCNDSNGNFYVSSGIKNPCGHCTASLKSLQVGIGGEPGSGHKIVAEIIDLKGGSLSEWFKKLIRPGAKTPDIYKMAVRFGWCTVGRGLANCEDAAKNSSPGAGQAILHSSGIIYCLPRDMKISLENGRIKFELEGTDSMEWTNQSKEAKPYGKDGQKKNLVTAIQDFCKDLGWAVPEFKQFDDDGNCTDLVFKWGAVVASEATLGPPGVWQGNLGSPLQTINEWLKNVRTKREKGIFITSDAGSVLPKLVFWEDAGSKCDKGDKCRPGRIMRHYLVNGGNQSPVISFSPTIAYNLMGSGSLATTTAGNAGDAPEQDCPGPAGEIHVLGISDTGLNLFGAKDYGRATERAVKANTLANRYQFPITAELKVQGDPAFDSQLCYIGKYISLIVFGGYYPDASPDGQCLRWKGMSTVINGSETGSGLTSPCVDFLSAPDWLIESVDHQIKEGSYHTSFKLKLLRQ